MKRHSFLAAIYPPGNRDASYHKGVFNYLMLKSKTEGFITVIVFPVRIYMMISKAQIIGKPHVQMAMYSQAGPFMDMCALYHSHIHLKSPTVTQPFWVMILHNEGALTVTTVSFDPLFLMPRAWLSWQALPTHRLLVPAQTTAAHAKADTLPICLWEPPLASNCPFLKSHFRVNTRCHGKPGQSYEKQLAAK